MRHASREVADGFHLLGLAKLPFQSALVGNVFNNDEQTTAATELKRLYRDTRFARLAAFDKHFAFEVADAFLRVQQGTQGAPSLWLGPER